MDYSQVRKSPLMRLALVMVMFVVMAVTGVKPATAANVGGQLRPNAGTVQTLPGQALHKNCFSVALSTRNPALVLAARADRMALYLINASTQNVGGAAEHLHPAAVMLTTNTTTNAGASPNPSNFTTINGHLLNPCSRYNTSGDKAGGCLLQQAGVTVDAAAIYAIGEGSTTATFDTLSRVSGCEYYP